MTGTQKCIVFLNSFGIGLFAPVLSLFILAHGCTLQGLALVMGVYSATVVIAEVPSGVFADMFGRKRAFYLACALTAAGFILMYCAAGMPLLVAGMILFGLGRAFLSGSLDSLIIEDCLHRGGDEALPRAAGSLLVFQCAGIASGSLLCGLLPDAGGYLPHIAVRMLTILAVVILCALFLKEAPASSVSRRGLRVQAGMVLAELRRKRLLRTVLLCIFGGSVTLFALEAYWQPQLSALIPQSRHYLLGVLCACGYGGNMLGSLLAGRAGLSAPKKRWRCYLLFLLLLGIAVCLLALQRSAAGFMICYILAQTTLGAANVPEQTLLNSLATDETRASLLSMASLFSQSAGILSSAACAALVLPLKISGVMALSGGFTVVAVMVASLVFVGHHMQNR